MPLSLSWLLAGMISAWAASLAVVYLAYLRCRRQLEGTEHRLRRTSDVHLATTEALAAAIDAKDQRAPNHLRRVQTYAVGIARAMVVPDEEVEALKVAALLHDVGKLAVPDHILAKPGPLTPEEYAKVRIHPQVAAEIIAGVPFPYPVAPLILNHHERWDGRGYPAGLKGEQIPLGARILCIADYFEALTSERPYHGAMSEEAAIALMVHNSGKVFDPNVVDTFIRLLPGMRAELARNNHGLPDPVARSSATTEELSAVDAIAPLDARASVFEEISLAHREIYALYQIAQTMGTGLGVADTMALIAPKLTYLVPFSTCALFLRADATDTLRCRFATGTDADLVEHLSLRGGGLTGWIARTRRDLMERGAGNTASGGDVPTALQSALVAPLILGEQFIGMLALYHTDANFYGDDHRRLLDRVCEQAAAVVHNAMVFEQTQEDSLTDALTGLPNTRFMRTHLTRELARAGRVKSEVSMIVLDLNGFKIINDHHGHSIGDRALRDVARVLRKTVRPYDVVVRYAGDEFIVVLSDCGHEEANDKRQELQQAVENIVFEAQPGDHMPLSISAGLAVYPHDGDTYEALLAEADRRMYLDKGRRPLSPQREPLLSTADFHDPTEPDQEPKPPTRH